jgi:hypothetical protein
VGDGVEPCLSGIATAVGHDVLRYPAALRCRADVRGDEVPGRRPIRATTCRSGPRRSPL